MARRKPSIVQSANFQWTCDDHDEIDHHSSPRHLSSAQKKKIRSQIAPPEKLTRKDARSFRQNLSADLASEGVNHKHRKWNYNAGEFVTLKRDYTHYDFGALVGSYASNVNYTVIPKGSVLLIIDSAVINDRMTVMWNGMIVPVWCSYFKSPDDDDCET